MSRKVTSDLWWKGGLVFCLDVETFHDGDGDGHGDFAGVIDRIDDLAGMGVTCLWLMPFFPSPGRDDGYDIVDFYSVDPRPGTLGDLAEMALGRMTLLPSGDPAILAHRCDWNDRCTIALHSPRRRDAGRRVGPPCSVVSPS